MPKHPLLAGSLLALLTMLIWSGWNVVTRLGVTHAMSMWDVTFWRFAVAGVLASPFAWMHRRTLLALPIRLMLAMVLCAGAPYVLLAGAGFSHAPASHGVLIPCMMALWVALISWWWQGEHFARMRQVGYGLLAATLIYRLITHAMMDWRLLLADGFFLGSSILWAIFTVLSRRHALPPLAAVALVSVGSLVLYCVPYGLTHGAHLASLPLSQSLLQIVYQGIFTSFVALWSYSRAIALIGASRTSAFAALIPLLATLMGIPLLNEWPTPHDMAFVALLSFGVLLTTGLLKAPIRIQRQ